MKGLPLSYNRDLQWDKRFVFDAVEASHDALMVLERLIRHVEIQTARAQALAGSDALCATDLAEHLVKRGVPFREAHEIIGKLVATAEHRSVRLRDLSVAELAQHSKHLDRSAKALINAQRSVEGKRSQGGTSPRQVRAALRRWQRCLGMTK